MIAALRLPVRRACLAALLGLFCAAAALAQPARGFMWEARKADAAGAAPVLLLATIHIGRAGQTELTDEQTARLQAVDAIAVEADVFDAQRTLAAFQRHAMYAADAPGLDRVLPAPLRARLERLLVRDGLAPEAVWRLKPWAVANNLVMLEAMRAGYSPALSTEAQLFALAQARQLPIVEIESVEQQLALFDGASAAQQLAYLTQVVDSVETGAGLGELKQLVDAWMRSDVRALQGLLETMHRSADPGERWVVAQVLDGRNPKMVDAIERYAASGRRHAVAVGALHFFGPQGLLAGLRARGYAITPLP